MEIINQKTKKIMEECKVRARDAGLKFDDETLEYVVTNQDMIRLSPKVMIPTLYDYWADDVNRIQGEEIYKVSPNNPYETVINSRPSISFYNDNNPDWLNVMIFYHVLGHIDFFQNNKFFEDTWDDDFVGQALADKRLINKLRGEHGRWVDYVIEFSRSLNNIVGFFQELSKDSLPDEMVLPEKLNYYFGHFLPKEAKLNHEDFLNEKEIYGNFIRNFEEEEAEELFFKEVGNKFPEFNKLFDKYDKDQTKKSSDLLEFLINNSPKLQKEDNQWMIPIMHIVRDTGLYFAPQRRTKIINEGWASYWHNELFLKDSRIEGHEIDYSVINAKVTSLPRVGLNPYAIGLRLFQHIEDLSDKGKLSKDFQKIQNKFLRDKYDAETGQGKDTLFKVRENFCDFTFINNFLDQDFVNEHNLFVVGERINLETWNKEYYVKSKKSKDYKEMLFDTLTHPPTIYVDEEKTDDDHLHIIHDYEGKQLKRDWIPNTMRGIEFFWGNKVSLETIEHKNSQDDIFENFWRSLYSGSNFFEDEKNNRDLRRVIYTMDEGKIKREVLDENLMLDI